MSSFGFGSDSSGSGSGLGSLGSSDDGSGGSQLDPRSQAEFQQFLQQEQQRLEVQVSPLTNPPQKKKRN